MRMFAAVDLDRGLREAVKRVQEELAGAGAGVKFVEPENLHFTVKFLGDIGEGQTSKVSDALEKALSGVEAFRIGIKRVSYFGPKGQARAVFLEVEEGRAQLEGLLESAGRALDCFRHESRAPKPHLTIGRAKSGRNMEELLAKIRELSGVKVGEMDVKLVKLKASSLTEKGPVYSDARVFRLA